MQSCEIFGQCRIVFFQFRQDDRNSQRLQNWWYILFAWIKNAAAFRITACPTGVAHTFMAADALKQGAAKLGYTIDVETQGSVGAKSVLTAESIARADYVILATDIEVDASRFAGKKCIVAPPVSRSNKP